MQKSENADGGVCTINGSERVAHRNFSPQQLQIIHPCHRRMTCLLQPMFWRRKGSGLKRTMKARGVSYDQTLPMCTNVRAGAFFKAKKKNTTSRAPEPQCQRLAANRRWFTGHRRVNATR